MDGLLLLIITCVSFALLIFLINRSVRTLMVTAVVVIIYATLRATGAIG